MALPSNNKQLSNVAVQNQRLKSGGTSGNSSQKENHQSPFVSSPFGHHGFHPQKLGKGPSAEPRVPKPPKPPEKPLMPYMRYSRKVWDQVKAQNVELKLWEIGKIIGQMWRDLPSDEKTEFVEEYEAEKVEYEKNLKTYYNSPPYLAYVAAKTKGKSAQITGEDRDSHDRSTSGNKQDRRIEIQPAEDDDDAEETYSIKHVSYARYLRNHHLIHEIFSDTVVPDVRTIVTSSRMQHFYCKIQSLKNHQKKMESEVEQLVEKFETTKRKLSEASDAFQEEIQKYCKRAVDEDYFNELVEKEYERLRKERISANNNNITLEESKKDTSPSTTTPLCDPSSTTNTDVFPEPPSSLVEEVSIEPNDGEIQTDQANKETFLTPPIPANNILQGSAPLNNQPHVNFASSYNQTNCIAPQNQNPMPPPSSVQPYFNPSQLFPNSPKALYSYSQGLPPYSATQNILPYSSLLPYQQHHISTGRPTQQHGSLPEFTMAPQSEDRDEFEDTCNSISPE
uniref:SWI/SNF-related matrix-associated actin-dependent regulator of chromatin subfamily E member 1 n=1 Tax=Lygus hesperus TaxID=30085 RepID=A0A0A9XU71_LYGHE